MVNPWDDSGDYDEWLNGLLENSDERLFDTDEAAEQILINYVRALEAVAKAAQAVIVTRGDEAHYDFLNRLDDALAEVFSEADPSWVVPK